MDETYEGWANCETWSLNLWLTNDQGLYEMTRERVADAKASYVPQFDFSPKECPPWVAGEAVKAFWEELTDPSEGLLTADKALEMVRDVGSEWRIDWDEIGQAFLASLDEDPIEDEQ